MEIEEVEMVEEVKELEDIQILLLSVLERASIYYIMYMRNTKAKRCGPVD